jgi:ribonuclease HI
VKHATLFADGGSRGNPGPSASGSVILADNGTPLIEIGEFLGVATNNVAEWHALLVGLRAALELGIEDLDVRLDSQLVVRQLSGDYRVKHPDLVPLFGKARSLIRQFARVDVQHIPRSENVLADSIVNRTLDDAAAQRRSGLPKTE